MIKILIFTLFSFSSGSALFSFLTKNWFFIRFCLLYCVIFAVALIIGNQYLMFVMYAAISLYLAKKEPDNIIYYYLVMLSAFPISIVWVIGVPGIDTLIVLNHSRVLILCLFLPVFFRDISSGKSFFDNVGSTTGLIDRLIFMFIILKIILYFRDFNFSSSIRSTIHILIDVWIPYYVISRHLKNINIVLVVLLYSSVVISVLAIIESVLYLRVYDYITSVMGGGYGFRYFRGGALRVYASMGSPLTLGFFLAVNLLIALRVRALIKCPAYVPWVLAFVILLGIEASGSRSPLATSMVGILILFWWSFGRIFVKNTSIVVLAVFIIFSYWLFQYGVEWLVSFDSEGKDGNFYYRYELLLNSEDAIKNNFWFGSSDFWSNPMLLNSMQGEGIIDITNTFLAEILASGFVALFLYLAIWIQCLRGLYNVNGSKDIAALLMAMCITTMLMLFISSPILTIPNYYWLLIALVSGFIRSNTVTPPS